MNKTILKPLLVVAALTSVNVSATEMSASEIMEKVYSRYDGETRISRQSIATCKYGTKNRRLTCTEKPRVKVSESYGKDFGEQGEDTKSLTIIVEPASEKGIGILQYDYGDITKMSDQWMYLSALGKPKRVASGTVEDDEPKKGALFGSEFSLEDMEKVRAKDYTFKILKETKYMGRPCYIVQITPTAKKARHSSYSRMISWVDKERFKEYKIQYYDRRNKYIKQKTHTGWEQQGDVWFSRKTVMKNLITQRLSVLTKEKMVFNVDVNDEFLTIRSLSDASFRERNMLKLKSHFLSNSAASEQKQGNASE